VTEETRPNAGEPMTEQRATAGLMPDAAMAAVAAAEAAFQPAGPPRPNTRRLRTSKAPGGKTYVWGIGRRKTAVARVRIVSGEGTLQVNGRDYKKYFAVERDRERVLEPLKATEAAKRFNVFVNVTGGGPTGQADAIVLGVARALVGFDSTYEKPLRDGGYLTRDSREVERKKPGQSGARRRFQFSKR